MGIFDKMKASRFEREKKQEKEWNDEATRLFNKFGPSDAPRIAYAYGKRQVYDRVVMLCLKHLDKLSKL